MNIETLKLNYAAVVASEQGKPVQSRMIDSRMFNQWETNKDPGWFFDTHEYRPAPEPVSRPWNCPADVPVGVCYVRRIGSKHWGSVAMSANGYGITGVGKFAWEDDSAACVGRIPWDALNTYEYSTDRKTWLPCSVTEPAQ